MTSQDNEGRRLAAELESAGFPTNGRGHGHIRFGWPGTLAPRGNLLVPVDDTAPEYLEMLAAVKAVLLEAESRGDAARRALSASSDEVEAAINGRRLR